MSMNYYEYTLIRNKKLPEAWQSNEVLDELENFLQQNWEQRSIFYDDEEISSKQQFLSFVAHGGVKTNNYIGTIVYKGEQLNIFPKMFKLDVDDQDTDDLSQEHLMMNLVNWLEYCNKIEYPFINISSELTDKENLKDLFIALYTGYVRNAINRGFYYQYIEESDDIRTIKGKFDFNDYITTKIPYKRIDQFKCTYSNFEFDNKVNQIIKYTCKLLINIALPKHQKILRNIIVKLDRVSDINCLPSDCDHIRLSKMHRNYRIILSMSKMFLLNKISDYSMGIQESFCFLFPMETLFEGFIGGFLQETIESVGGKVYLQKSDMNLIDDIQYKGESLGSAFKMKHDILVEIDSKVFILDTKYKGISRFGDDPENIKKIVSEEPSEGDVRQVCEYARKRNITDVYLLYPMYRYERPETDFPKGISKGINNDINIHFIRLPFILEDNDNNLKDQLKLVIKQMFSL